MLRKKIVALILSLLLAGVYVSCKKSARDNPQEMPKITILTCINVDTEGATVNDNDYINYVRKAVGVDIEYINEGSTSNYRQKMNTMMASGEHFDALMLMDTYQRIELARWASEGMLMELDEYLPKYAPLLLSNLKPAAWELTKYNGKTFAIPFQRYDSSPYLTFLRKEWLDNLGINPAADLNTIDDWYRMLKRFTTDDPDRNGVNDTYGIVSTTSGFHYSNWSLLDSFGAARAKYVNGELLPNYVLPEYKEWLKFMNRLYSEKILDPEFIANDGAKMWEKVASKKYGMFLYFFGLQEYLSKGLSRDDLVAVPPPKRADGSEAKYIYSSPNRHMMALTSQCSNVEAVLKFFNWTCTEEGAIFLYAGLEGKDYDIVNNKIEIRPDRRGKNLGWRQLTLGVQQPNVDQEPIKSILAQSLGPLGIEHLAASGRYGGYNELELYCPIFEELSQYDFDKLVSDFTDKAIMGVINIDAEWDAYVRNFRRMGGDRKIELSTKWYNETYKK